MDASKKYINSLSQERNLLLDENFKNLISKQNFTGYVQAEILLNTMTDTENLCKGYAESLGLADFYCYTHFFAIPPNDKVPIHIDYNERSRIYSILYNLDNRTIPEWIIYKMTDEALSRPEITTEKPYYTFKDSDVEEVVARKKLSETLLVKTNIAHSVKNYSLTDWAYLVSIRLSPNFNQYSENYGF